MLSIKTKIILSLLCVVMGVLGFYETNRYFETRRQLYTELNDTADREIQRLTESLKLPLWEMDETWQNKVAEIELLNKKIYAVIITDNQQVIRGKIRDTNWQVINADKAVQGNFIQRHGDIFHDDEKIGAVSVYLTTQFVKEPLYQEVFARLISLVALSISIILSLMIILNTLVVRPLQTILQAIEAITHGDYSSELMENRTEEMTLLANGVNEMKLAIQEREHAILASENDYRVLSEHLEQRVIERTEALELNNQHLQALSAELEKTKDKAEAANRAKSIFLANMSHELRTPMNAVLGFSQLMQKDSTLNVRQRENLNIINNSGKHLLELINDILDMAKIEAGRIIIENSNFDLGDLVRDTIDMMHQRAEVKGLELFFDQSSDFPRFVNSDESKLRQILLNLISNAVKYTKRGQVRVRLTADFSVGNDNGVLIFTIEDSGTGISEQDLPRIFETFVQVGVESDQKGTGLGLPITKKFAELMGGDISVTSVLNQGSCFTLKLPVTKISFTDIPAAAHHAELQVVALSAGQPRYRVLIVEDQVENRLLLRRLLEPVGFDICEVVNGQEAVEQFPLLKPDFIWMDRRMPIMDGIEATRQIRALPHGDKVKIVAVTASVFLEQRQAFLAVGVDDIVNKPYRDSEIFDAMKKHLGVCFDYEMPEETLPPEKEIINLATLKNVSTELVAALHSAAMELDIERCLSLIEQIQASDSILATQLTERVNQFDFETITQWLK